MTITFRKLTLVGGVALALAAACNMAQANDHAAGGASARLAAVDARVEAGPLDASSIEAIQARVAKASRIAGQIRGTSAIDEANYLTLGQSLLGASDAGLDAAASAMSLKGALNSIRTATAKTSGTKILGDLTRDFVFYPIVPCRLLDTRAAVMITGGVPYGVDFDGGNPGNAAGCTWSGIATQMGGALGAPISRAAMVINVTVVGPTGPGYIVARPVGSTNLTATQNFAAGQNVASMAVVQDANVGGNEFELFSSTTTHVVVDVLGVFAPPAATALDCTNVTAEISAAAGARVVDTLNCAAGYTVTGGGVDTCGPTGSCLNDNQTLNGTGVTGNGWFSSITNTSGGTKVFNFYARCCRTPGR